MKVLGWRPADSNVLSTAKIKTKILAFPKYQHSSPNNTNLLNNALPLGLSMIILTSTRFSPAESSN